MAISDLQRVGIDHKYSAIAETPRGKLTRQMLESQPAVRAAAGKRWLTHLVYHPVSSALSDLTCWHLWFEDQFGREAADNALEVYLAHESVKMTFCVWVYGIQPERSYHFNDISLVPVEEMPDSPERDHYLTLVRNLQSPVAHAAFTAEEEVPRVVDDEAEAQHLMSDLARQPWGRLCEAVALVNGLEDLSCAPHWQCAYGPPNAPFGPWTGGGKSRTCFDIVGVHSRVFSETHSQDLQEMLECYDQLALGERKRLQVILELVQRSKRQQAIEFKILDLGIAAEMLLMEHSGNNDPISLPFRLRGCWLLGSNSGDRKTIHDTLKTLYDYRCQIAHTGEFKNESDGRTAYQRFPEFCGVVERILRMALSPIYPHSASEWLALILGKDAECEAD